MASTLALVDSAQSPAAGSAPESAGGAVFTLTRNIPERVTDPVMGVLLFGDQRVFTLEPPWRNNERNVSCIPEGTYPCVLAWSPRFDRLTPHLLDVPDRSCIEIHAGNVVEDTCGCILVGTVAVNQTVYHSREALRKLTDWLALASRTGIPKLIVKTEIEWRPTT